MSSASAGALMIVTRAARTTTRSSTREPQSSLRRPGPCGQLGPRTAHRMSGRRALLLGRCVSPHRLTRWANTGREDTGLTITCGIDWAENHHDVALVDGSGQLVAKRHIDDDAEGYRQLLNMLAEAGDSPKDPIPVAVETARGLLFARLRATGRKVYSINPMAVARYRERHRVARAKSDHADAMALANSCARTRTSTARCPPTPSSPRPSRCSPAPSRTRSGTGPSSTTSSAHTSSSTSRLPWRPSKSGASDWTPGKRGPCLLRLRNPRRPRD
ncbi:mini-circle putative transposase for IS117 [Streptomyces olivochromogenes]|uniref:Mini-circle putative transposase for IS117 n=1 Tax=Streptomyces olivochromogenes TaxID=1963 RepID=A0A286PGT3_STROL|nr:mini-circle putative transposase for IS117 [Streptomyces olivochromogenes]